MPEGCCHLVEKKQSLLSQLHAPPRPPVATGWTSAVNPQAGPVDGCGKVVVQLGDVGGTEQERDKSEKTLQKWRKKGTVPA